jgi:hypothetical protein
LNLELLFWECFYQLDDFFIIKFDYYVHGEGAIEVEEPNAFGYLDYVGNSNYYLLWVCWKSRVSRILQPIRWFEFFESANYVTSQYHKLIEAWY